MQIESEPRQGKMVALPGIHIKTTLPDNFDLIVRGEVESLYQHTRDVRGWGPVKPSKENFVDSVPFIQKKVGVIIQIRQILDNVLSKIEVYFDPFSEADKNTAHGFMHTRPDGSTVYEIAYRADLSRDMKLFAEGHESGELLDDIGRQDDLQKALDAEKLSIDASKYKGEDFADLGGFLALYLAKKAGDDTVRIPFFKTNADNREKMGRLFDLEPSIGPKEKPRENWS